LGPEVTNFGYGATAENWNDPHVPSLSEWPFWHRDTAETVQRWKESNVTMSRTKEWRQVYQDAMQPILDAGFVQVLLKRHNHGKTDSILPNP
jgi:hypothetical protein